MSEPGAAAPSPSVEEVRAQIGRRFPGGTYTIEPWRAWLIADVVLEPKAGPGFDASGGKLAHPLFAWLAATGGWGLTWDDLFGWFGATAADGPVFGEHETALHRPLETGATYRVTGGIVSADRKTGRTTGPFDVVGYQMELHDESDGAHVATCFNSIVFPRRR